VRRTALAPLALASIAFGCASGGPEQAFRERPYVWAYQGRVELSSCRWLLEQPIGVRLAGPASDEERHAFALALGALPTVLPGLRLVEAPAGAASISVRFVDGPVPRPDGTRGSGRAIVDCRLDVGGARAALVAAQVEVARVGALGFRGRERLLTPEERLGVLLHELGHALGAPGHSADGSDLLAGGDASQRRAGARALAREPLASPTLVALYAHAPGEVLRSADVDAWRTFELDRLARLAAEHRLDGPYLRASEGAGRVFWRDAAGNEWGFLVADLARLAEHPGELLLLPEASTRGALPRRTPPP
jgi:hypothetical protein